MWRHGVDAPAIQYLGLVASLRRPTLACTRSYRDSCGSHSGRQALSACFGYREPAGGLRVRHSRPTPRGFGVGVRVSDVRVGASSKPDPRVVTTGAVPPVLKDYERLRMDESPDEKFYETANFAPYSDENFVAQVQELYGAHLKPEHAILDLGASWTSHLPAGYEAAYTVGLGMNREELDANAALDKWDVHNVNAADWSGLPYGDSSFDCVLCCCAIQYFTHPERVLRDVLRVLKPGGCILVAMSRASLDPEKTVRAWLEGRRGPSERLQLLEACLAAAGFGPARLAGRSQVLAAEWEARAAQAGPAGAGGALHSYSLQGIKVNEGGGNGVGPRGEPETLVSRGDDPDADPFYGFVASKPAGEDAAQPAAAAQPTPQPGEPAGGEAAVAAPAEPPAPAVMDGDRLSKLRRNMDKVYNEVYNELVEEAKVAGIPPYALPRLPEQVTEESVREVAVLIRNMIASRQSSNL